MNIGNFIIANCRVSNDNSILLFSALLINLLCYSIFFLLLEAP